MSLSDRVHPDQLFALELAELVRGHLKPGALSITVYNDIIEVSGTPNDQDEVNTVVRGDFTELNFIEFKHWFAGWEVEDARG